MNIEEIYRKEIIIFGASKAGEKIYNFLSEMNLKVKYFTDNNPNKWNKMFCGQIIKAPELLYQINKEKDYIIIGSMYVGDISKQLDNMGLYGLYCEMNDFIYRYINDNINKINPYNFITAKTDKKSEDKKYILSLPSGLVLGGIEIWSINIYELLEKQVKKPKLLSLSNNNGAKLILLQNKKYNILELLDNKVGYFERLYYIIDNIKKHLPAIVIPNASDDIFLACYILKYYHSEKIKVVSVVHSDIEFSYIQNTRYEEIIDKFICVSDDISEKLKQRLKHRERDIFTQITPVRLEQYTRTYSKEKEPIKLGYVGRLEKSDKRADRLIDLIKVLETRDIHYQMNIVGEGNYYYLIKEYVEVEGLEKKVHLLGGIPNTLIYDFWRQQDIFINVSDLEGTSISMLEGLYNGAIPILTDVSGVRKFVTHGENGFIVNTGDIESMVDYIQYLEQNRDALKNFGQNIHEKVSEICNPDKFIEEFIRICEFD